MSVFTVCFDPTRPHNTQLFLPSGISVLGIEDWAERLAMVA